MVPRSKNYARKKIHLFLFKMQKSAGAVASKGLLDGVRAHLNQNVNIRARLVVDA